MKKLNLNLLLSAMLVFTVAAWAQGSGGGAGGGGASGGGQGGGAAASGGQGAQAGGAGGSSAAGAASGGVASTAGTETTGQNRTLEGCIVQQGTDFYLQPIKGNKAMVRLVPQNGQDLSAHVGHTVKVRGAREVAANNPNAPVEGKDTNITGRDMASAAQGTNVPNSLTTPDQNPPKANDALAGSGALPQGSEVKGAREFAVTHIDMVSDTCNMKGGKHSKGMENGGATPPNNPPF